MNRYYVSIADIPTEEAIKQNKLYICAECLSEIEANQNRDFLVSEWLDKTNKEKQYIKPMSQVYIAILTTEGKLELTV
jgi:hypothetical protein